MSLSRTCIRNIIIVAGIIDHFYSEYFCKFLISRLANVSNNIGNFTVDARTIRNNIHLVLGGRLSTEALCRNASAIAPRTLPRFCDNEVSIFGRFFDRNENAPRSLLRNGTLIECRPERKGECRVVAPLARNKSVLPATLLFLFTYFASEMMQML